MTLRCGHLDEPRFEGGCYFCTKLAAGLIREEINRTPSGLGHVNRAGEPSPEQLEWIGVVEPERWNEPSFLDRWEQVNGDRIWPWDRRVPQNWERT